MNILVCIKQVPDTSEYKADPVTNTLIREGVPSIVNPYDTYALEAAACIKDLIPETKITVITMGPMQAVSALKECLAASADKAYIVSDRSFGGSDTMATSYILAYAIRKIEETEGKFDAIFCGKQTLDGDTAQVGQTLAEIFNYAQVTGVNKAEAEGETMKVVREREDDKAVVRVKLPCVLTFVKGEKDPRFPNLKRKMAANRAVVPVISLADLPELDRSRIGIDGSPTKVGNTFCVEMSKDGVIIKEKSGAASAQKLVELLSAANAI